MVAGDVGHLECKAGGVGLDHGLELRLLLWCELRAVTENPPLRMLDITLMRYNPLLPVRQRHADTIVICHARRVVLTTISSRCGY